MNGRDLYAELVRCPRCEQGFLAVLGPIRDTIQCDRCAAAYPWREGVIDLLENDVVPRSLAQRTMEAAPIVRVYESRWLRRNRLTQLFMRISFEREQELILDTAHLSGGERVLDLAGGPGIYSRPLARRLSTGVVVLLDLSWPMLSYANGRARQEGIDNIAFVHGTAQRLPFPRNHLDFVLCSGALHLFPDVPLALAEVHRVLKPGGSFTVAAFRRREGRIPALVSRARRRLFGLGDFTPSELSSRLLAAGFSRVECHHARGIWLIMTARKEDRDTPRQNLG